MPTETVRKGVINDCEIAEEVMVDRSNAIDAAVVRLMKKNRTLSHTMLMEMLEATLKFPVTVAVLKLRIEAMIEAEYIQRRDDDNSVYVYVV
jgi:hypothetical protein